MSRMVIILDNAANAARQAAVTEASFVVRSAGYQASLQGLQDDLTDNDRLRVPDAVADNEVVLSALDGDLQIRITDAVIKVEQSKSIVTTKLVNRGGTVKEYVQNGDYEITVEGSLIGEQGKFPYDDLNNVLISLIEKVENLRMASAYTDAFGITEVVLKKATFDQNQMKLFNVMPFRLEFSSDTSYDFLVEE